MRFESSCGTQMISIHDAAIAREIPRGALQRFLKPDPLADIGRVTTPLPLSETCCIEPQP